MTVENLIISDIALEPGLDFDLLRREGMAYIERIAGALWNDYNIHDPGITILEHVCYAITDLSYRLTFPVSDLLASKDQKINTQNHFFTARQIYTTQPVTITDYRKILVDIPGVRNAWLEPYLTNDEKSQIYYSFDEHKLKTNTSESDEIINLNGLYRVLIVRDPEIVGVDLIGEVKEKLYSCRNFSEDFAEVIDLPYEIVSIKAKIQVEEHTDIIELLCNIYFALSDYVSPKIKFYTLEELLKKGRTAEEIFSGPRLSQGFIDDIELIQQEHKTNLYSSDVINILFKIPGVKNVHDLFLKSDKSNGWCRWVLNLDKQNTPFLCSMLDLINNGYIEIYKDQVKCNINNNIKEVTNAITLRKKINSADYSNSSSLDLSIPMGTYRHLNEYTSIQHDFPENYGIGRVGLNQREITPLRLAQAKQLKSYLLFFDQILANYFAQLANLKTIFQCDSEQSPTTYFTQLPISVEGLDELIIDKNFLADLENNEISIERKNRLVDHLLARFGEKFTDYTLLLYQGSNTQAKQQALPNKMDYLTHYADISYSRNVSFNYKKSLSNNNYIGLKKKISHLLALNENEEPFYMIEHILLRPNKPLSVDYSLAYKSIIRFYPSNFNVNLVSCEIGAHALNEGDEIRIFDNPIYAGIYTIRNVTTTSFDIDKSFVNGHSAKFITTNQATDPYSCQISFIFSNLLPQLADIKTADQFKKFAQNVIAREVPAHLTVYIHWFDDNEMKDFISAYTSWLDEIKIEYGGLYAVKLMHLLNMFSIDVIVNENP